MLPDGLKLDYAALRFLQLKILMKLLKGVCMYPQNYKYQMPAEWTTHECTFIAWPVLESMCYPDNYDCFCRGFSEIIQAVSEFEPVVVIVNPEKLAQVRKMFDRTNISFVPIQHNDAWIRDNGPTFLLDSAGNRAGVNWKFNAWGGKYPHWDLDDQVAPKLLKHLGITCFDAPLVIEGGSIHVDGEGTLLTTEECLLNTNRNPKLAREDIEKYLRQFLNIEKVIWLKQGLSGDETDGHIDNAACFAAPGKILLQTSTDPEDENYRITQENLKILTEATDAKRRKLEVIPIAQPPRAEFNGHRLTLSYLNFYFVNGGIILPVFGGPASQTDREAEKILRSVFPKRHIRTVDGMALIREGGNVHCITQQLPAGINNCNQIKEVVSDAKS